MRASRGLKIVRRLAHLERGAAREDVSAFTGDTSFAARRRDGAGGMALKRTRRDSRLAPSGAFGVPSTAVPRTRETPSKRQSQHDEKVPGEPDGPGIQ